LLVTVIAVTTALPEQGRGDPGAVSRGHLRRLDQHLANGPVLVEGPVSGSDTGQPTPAGIVSSLVGLTLMTWVLR